MTYYPDLSDYVYDPDCVRTGCVNVGWIEQSRPFEEQEPSEEMLEALWEHCGILVSATRGVQPCDLCGSGAPITADRGGTMRLLGTAEIRVFGKHNRIFAAPSLLYHYVSVHKYRPPDEFTQALLAWPSPADEEYFRLLNSMGLEWKKAQALDGPLVVKPPPESRSS